MTGVTGEWALIGGWALLAAFAGGRTPPGCSGRRGTHPISRSRAHPYCTCRHGAQSVIVPILVSVSDKSGPSIADNLPATGPARF
ncbi:uncharacterized protein BDZ83DRAFT_227980 [Colletotrichum acutatum]|uniref:Secreted protein n=1 Tax=Glomerella acutata TaxID=27357 RepID=A0AAD8UNP9_GLOAC|nr:uncharacterized protein BDZ83DRAFT_227980 [Colletotrichum acutatum]KAK1727131.1 hypothetical protein BDZ83DRAFT_227980 [Colletotrichum acutatum]